MSEHRRVSRQRAVGAENCKPEGAERGSWVKLGWAYTTDPTTPRWEPELDERFPEVVLRGAARLNPALKVYYERLPRTASHYGGYYTMTKENWPLIGRAGPDGSYVVGALSEFGTMAACAAGYLAAALAAGAEVADYAGRLGLARYDDPEFDTMIRNSLPIWSQSPTGASSDRSDCRRGAAHLTSVFPGEVSERLKEHAWKVCVR